MSKVYPVIHYLSDAVALEQAVIAKEAGADGVFLISHHGQNEKLIDIGLTLKSKFPTFKVGINFLGQPIMDAAKVAEYHNFNMIWGDYCGVSSQGLTSEGEDLKVWARDNKDIEVFASVAFKYQAIEINPPLAAKEAKNAGFIPTTSGSATGSAPQVEKISGMSDVTDGLLAVASGMTVENIGMFKNHLSHILVSTGVSVDDYRFDKEKLVKFIQIVKAKK